MCFRRFPTAQRMAISIWHINRSYVRLSFCARMNVCMQLMKCWPAIKLSTELLEFFIRYIWVILIKNIKTSSKHGKLVSGKANDVVPPISLSVGLFASLGLRCIFVSSELQLLNSQLSANVLKTKCDIRKPQNKQRKSAQSCRLMSFRWGPTPPFVQCCHFWLVFPLSATGRSLKNDHVTSASRKTHIW